jgi:hypothetical protein
MARIQTQINGISTSSAYPDGDCYSLVNLRPKNGALHPVSPRKVSNELSQKYDIIYVHQNNSYKNWIGIKHTGNTSEVYDRIQTAPELIAESPKITSVQQIGNTLSLITGEGIRYLLYDDGEYKELGKMPEMEKIDCYINSIEGNSGFGSTVPSNMKEAVIGLFNSTIEKINNGEFHYTGSPIYDGEFFLVDSHLLVFAFRLYDGSTVKQTSPILLCPSREEWFSETKIEYYMENPSYVSVMAYQVLLEFDTSYLDKWKDIIKSIDVFLSPGLGYNSALNIVDDIPTSSAWILKDQSTMIKNYGGKQ